MTKATTEKLSKFKKPALQGVQRAITCAIHAENETAQDPSPSSPSTVPPPASKAKSKLKSILQYYIRHSLHNELAAAVFRKVQLHQPSTSSAPLPATPHSLPCAKLAAFEATQDSQLRPSTGTAWASHVYTICVNNHGQCGYHTNLCIHQHPQSNPPDNIPPPLLQDAEIETPQWSQGLCDQRGSRPTQHQ